MRFLLPALLLLGAATGCLGPTGPGRQRPYNPYGTVIHRCPGQPQPELVATGDPRHWFLRLGPGQGMCQLTVTAGSPPRVTPFGAARPSPDGTGGMPELEPGSGAAVFRPGPDRPRELIGIPRGREGLHAWPWQPAEAAYGSPRPLTYSNATLARVGRVLKADGPGRLDAPAHRRPSLHLGVSLRRPAARPWEPGLRLACKAAGSWLEARAGVRPDGLGSLRYRLRLLLVTAGGERVLQDRLLNRVDGDWHRLSLTRAGVRVDLLWDGALVHTFQSVYGGRGECGLTNGRGLAFFKDFQVAPPPGAGTVAGLPDPGDPLLADGVAREGSWTRGPDIHTTGPLHTLPPPPCRRGPWLAAVDWDGDGDQDLLISRPTFPLALLENLGGWDFQPPRTLRGTDGRPLYPTIAGAIPASADLDGDGAADLLLGCVDGSLRWYPGYWFLRPRP